MSHDCLLDVEDKFGPIVNGCDKNFDFTLLFEETVLFLLPLCVTICLAAARFAQLWGTRALVKGGILLPLKLALWTAAFATQLAFLVLAATRDNIRTRASLAAGCIGFIGTAVLGCLSYFDHRRVVRTSSILVLYLLATTPMDAFRARTLWRMLGGRDPAIAITALASCKVCLLVLELVWKCALAYERGMCDAPEESNGIVERALMLRMAPVFWAGFRMPLQADHLFNIHKSLLTGELGSIVSVEKQKEKRQENGAKNHSGSPSLPLALFRAHTRELLDPILPRLCFLALSFAQPFLVRRAINYTSDQNDQNRFNKGSGLIAAYALVYYGIAFTSSLYEQKAARAATVIRADLALRIYQHSLELDRVAVDAKDSSTTMMTADMERVQQGIRKSHDAWASLATVGIGLWLIEVKLGGIALVTLALIGGSLILAGYWSGRSSQYQKVWMVAIERRLHKTVQVLKGIKSIKQLGATQAIDDTLTSERTAEIGLSKAFRMQLIALVTLSYTSLTMLPALGLAVHVARIRNRETGQLLSAVTAFEAMTLFQLVSAGIQEAVAHAMEVMVAYGTLQRVGGFLNQNTWAEPRKALGEADSQRRANSEKEAEADKDVAIRFDRVSARRGGKKDKENRGGKDDMSEKTEGEDGDDMLITEATFRVPLHGVTVIAGPTGSGKSTLLRLALGELTPASGTVYVRGQHDETTALCSQAPWIASLSIRDNIVGPFPFQEDRYRTVLDACALEYDLREMPEGDQHMCGLNGQSLSGGQKVRVALARAIYSQAKVVILDDCFVGLDVETERQVIDKLFGTEGLLNRGSITTILATSSLKYVNLAHHVVFIDAKGAIVQEGRYADMASDVDEIRAQAWKADGRSTARPADQEESDKLPPTALTTDPASQRGANGDMAVYRWYFGAMGWGNFAMFILLCMLFVFGVIFPQVWLSTWTQRDGNSQRETLPTFFGVFFGVGSLAWIAFGCACVWLFLRVAVRTAIRFHKLLLRTVLQYVVLALRCMQSVLPENILLTNSAPMGFFSATDSGITLNRFSQDLQITDMELPLAFIGTTMNILMLVAQCIVVTIGTHYAGFAILAIVVCIGGFHELYLRTSRRLRIMDIESRAPVLSLLLESLDGLPTVRAYGWAQWYMRRGLAVLAQSQLPFHLLQSAQVTLNFAVDLFVATLATVVIGIGVNRGSSTGGSGIGLALFNIVGLGLSVKGVVYFWTSLEITLGALARIRDFTSETASEQKPDDETPPPPSWPSDGAIHIEDLVVKHAPSLPPTLSNLSLDVKPGAKVALCGRTGSGKSTLLGALLRLVDIAGGSIVVDGLDITSMSREDVRSRFIAVPQDALHMSVNVRAYARLYGIDNDDEVILALKDAGLWTAIARGGGLDMVLGEDTLSHGQHQLLGLTLARLRQGRVVLMDEPTSHVDADIQARLRHAVFGTFAASTVLCISHQVDTILEFDTVAVLDQGKIVELGNPNDLMLQSTSCFAQLYSTGELH